MHIKKTLNRFIFWERNGQMNFRWKKSMLCLVIGIPAIFMMMLVGTFGSLSVKSAIKPQVNNYDMETLARGAKDYKIDGSTWTSLSDDAWISLLLLPKGKIQEIEIDIQLLNSNPDENAQVYYSRGNVVDGNKFVETVLHDGNNIITFDADTDIKSLRFDLTAIQGSSFNLKHIIVHFTREKQVLFWIFTPVLLILYSVLAIIYVNRHGIVSYLEKRPAMKRKLEEVEQMFSLAYSDFKSRFSGSYLGIFWGIIQPMSTILLFWFVFQVGFRSNPIDNVPFILWLSAGMIPWNYFYDSWAGGTGAFISYSYIVKKVVFKVEMLPIVKILASAILNVFFNLILLAIYVRYGEFPGYHIVDMIYFSICIMAFSLGLSYITATLNAFIKDIGQFLGIALQFLMWLTPMMWDYHMLDSHSWFYNLNPLHYVINGYREALINGKWFFSHWGQMLWFWGVTLTCIFFGKKLMKRLKIHFADVL